MTPPTLTAHILVVDDVEKNTRLLADLLTAKGYRTSTAGSGEQALEQIDAEAPDLVLLDVMMPGLSGYEVCQALRAAPRHALLPVVLVTALDPATERVKGIAAGADDFLSKPINQAELLARVRSLLRVKALQDEVQRLRAELLVWHQRFGQLLEVAADSAAGNADPQP
jgi:DNA-binding response OmpR family regulator